MVTNAFNYDYFTQLAMPSGTLLADAAAQHGSLAQQYRAACALAGQFMPAGNATTVFRQPTIQTEIILTTFNLPVFHRKYQSHKSDGRLPLLN